MYRCGRGGIRGGGGVKGDGVWENRVWGEGKCVRVYVR